MKTIEVVIAKRMISFTRIIAIIIERSILGRLVKKQLNFFAPGKSRICGGIVDQDQSLQVEVELGL